MTWRLLLCKEVFKLKLTEEQIQTLRDYKTNPDDDNIRIKNICKQTLIDDPLIIYLLNNKELEERDADPTEYINKNILNNFLIHETQYDVQNIICLGTESTEEARYNEVIKYERIIFYILCEEKTNIEKITGSGRHDLIGARIKHLFNWTNKFGTQCKLVDERESVTDNDYATRTLVFEMEAPKNIVKTKGRVSQIVNKIGG